jgi:hypothetical protein
VERDKQHREYIAVRREHQKNRRNKSFELDYDATRQRFILRILDVEGMYPLLICDPESGAYEIKKTRRGGLQMTK